MNEKITHVYHLVHLWLDPFSGQLTNSLVFKKPEDSLSLLHKPTIGPYLEQILSNLIPLPNVLTVQFLGLCKWSLTFLFFTMRDC